MPRGWYSGNTHTHYHLEIDEDPDDRLRLVPPAEALDVSVISYLSATTRPTSPTAIRSAACRSSHATAPSWIWARRSRNNRASTDFGYGHCLFLNIPKAVEPVSTGLLSPDGKAPDFPTISMLCAAGQAHGRNSRSGATTAAVWKRRSPSRRQRGRRLQSRRRQGCRLRALLPLAQLRLQAPGSSGTDWWIYDHNRVFVQVEGDFTYDTWIAGLRAGRTFISNGPLLEFSVDGKQPGATLQASERLRVKARAISRLPFDRLQIVQDGVVVAEQVAVNRREATLEREIPVEQGGWIAARIESSAKTHAAFGVFAHSSPVYYRVPATPFRRAESAGSFVDEIEASVRYLKKNYKFASEADKAVAMGRFEAARKIYGALAASSA